MNNEIITPSVTDTSIRIRTRDASSEKETMYDWHFHNEFELFIVYEGLKTFYFKDRTVKLTENDIVFVNRRTPHKTFTPRGSRGMLLQFDDDFSFDESHFDKYLLDILRNKEAAFCVFRAGTALNAQLRSCFEKISKEYLTRDKFYNMYIRSYVCEMLACLYRHNVLSLPDETTRKKTVSSILPALDYISRHYSEHISLSDMSSLVHVDKSHFCKLFKKATNTSFLNYLNFIRICHAEALLRETKKSVTEIAAETGFSSSSYFSETFRKINLLSPTTYRKMAVSGDL